MAWKGPRTDQEKAKARRGGKAAAKKAREAAGYRLTPEQESQLRKEAHDSQYPKPAKRR